MYSMALRENKEHEEEDGKDENGKKEKTTREPRPEKGWLFNSLKETEKSMKRRRLGHPPSQPGPPRIRLGCFIPTGQEPWTLREKEKEEDAQNTVMAINLINKEVENEDSEYSLARDASIDDENEDGAAVSNSPPISIVTLSQRPLTTPRTRPSLPTRMSPRKSHSAAKTATTKLLSARKVAPHLSGVKSKSNEKAPVTEDGDGNEDKVQIADSTAVEGGAQSVSAAYNSILGGSGEGSPQQKPSKTRRNTKTNTNTSKSSDSFSPSSAPVPPASTTRFASGDNAIPNRSDANHIGRHPPTAPNLHSTQSQHQPSLIDFTQTTPVPTPLAPIDLSQITLASLSTINTLPLWAQMYFLTAVTVGVPGMLPPIPVGAAGEGGEDLYAPFGGLVGFFGLLMRQMAQAQANVNVNGISNLGANVSAPGGGSSSFGRPGPLLSTQSQSPSNAAAASTNTTTNSNSGSYTYSLLSQLSNGNTVPPPRYIPFSQTPPRYIPFSQTPASTSTGQGTISFRTNQTPGTVPSPDAFQSQWKPRAQQQSVPILSDSSGLYSAWKPPESQSQPRSKGSTYIHSHYTSNSGSGSGSSSIAGDLGGIGGPSYAMYNPPRGYSGRFRSYVAPPPQAIAIPNTITTSTNPHANGRGVGTATWNANANGIGTAITPNVSGRSGVKPTATVTGRLGGKPNAKPRKSMNLNTNSHSNVEAGAGAGGPGAANVNGDFGETDDHDIIIVDNDDLRSVRVDSTAGETETEAIVIDDDEGDDDFLDIYAPASVST